jgi:aspartate/methionine/tyrosine aminotransferase
MIDYDALISDRARRIDVSGIRRVFELGAKLKDPINLSIGQPDFPFPGPLKDAAIRAIREDRNGYTLTQGSPDLLNSVSNHLAADVDWRVPSDELGLMVTSGTSGAVMLAFMALVNPGDEVIIPDPYFVLYPSLGPLVNATMVYCDTYPDFRMTADRVEPLITPRTKLIILNSPANPTGVVLSEQELRDLVALCEERGILLLSDEIYDQFVYSDALEGGRCPSPARWSRQVLLVRGFGKSYGCTGWRLGYVAGPRPVIQQMMKLQQYSYVCAPSMAQAAMVHAFDIDISEHVRSYERRRDLVERAFHGVADVPHVGGAFYAFVEVPSVLGVAASEFCERAVGRNVLIIPGRVFSRRDTHFRLSFAVPESKLERGLQIIVDLMSPSRSPRASMVTP